MITHDSGMYILVYKGGARVIHAINIHRVFYHHACGYLDVVNWAKVHYNYHNQKEYHTKELCMQYVLTLKKTKRGIHVLAETEMTWQQIVEQAKKDARIEYNFEFEFSSEREYPNHLKSLLNIC